MNLRLAPAYQIDRCRNVINLLARISPHQKHTHLNPVTLRRIGGPDYLIHLDAALHRVEDALAAAFRTDPDPIATHIGQRLQHLVLHHAVGARYGFEWHAQIAPLELFSIAEKPWMTD